jgi:hypothetical protein
VAASEDANIMKNYFPALVAGLGALLVQHAGVATDTAATLDHSGLVAAASAQPRFIPFGVGEKMDFQLKFGLFDVGKASMEMKSIEPVRGRPAWKAELKIDGQAPLNVYSLLATHTTWFDTSSFNSLRYSREQKERNRERDTFFEIFPERSTFRVRAEPDTMPEMPSVPAPLDEASFLYFIRTAPLEVGQTYTWDRYFRPDRNPVVIRVLRKETISVPRLGQMDAIVIQPTIKTPGLFSQGGNARVWLSDDPLRLILKIQSEVAGILGSLHLNLTNYTPPRTPGR